MAARPTILGPERPIGWAELPAEALLSTACTLPRRLKPALRRAFAKLS